MGATTILLLLFNSIDIPQVKPKENKVRSIKDITECSATKEQARGLDNQILTMIVKNNPNFLVPIKDLNVQALSSTFLYLQPAAKDSLNKAIQERGELLKINSAYRSIAQQQILYNHSKYNRCGIGIVARPGRSNHQSGLSIDIQDYNGWKSSLEKYGWKWFGAINPVHFDYIGSERKDISSLPARGFQQLWNLANPEDRIEVNGEWNAETEQRFNNSPVSGFDIQINIFD